MLGETTAKGLETSLRVNTKENQDFRWDLAFNFSRIRTKVVDTYPGVDRIYPLRIQWQSRKYMLLKGERYGSIIGTGYSRNDNGQILVDADVYPIWDEAVNLGHTEADWTGGASTTFSYKGFYASASSLDIRQGGFTVEQKNYQTFMVFRKKHYIEKKTLFLMELMQQLVQQMMQQSKEIRYGMEMRIQMKNMFMKIPS